MRIFSTSSLGWLGCSAAAAAAILSLSTTDADVSALGDGSRSADKAPIAFRQDQAGASISSASRGSLSYARLSQPGGSGGHEPSVASGKGAHAPEDANRGRDGLSGGIDQWHGFSGIEFGNNAVTPPNSTPPAQGQPLSFSLQHEPLDAQFFLDDNGGFSFPGPPSGVPTGSGSTTETGSSNGSGSVFIVTNGGSPWNSSNGGSDNGGFSIGGTEAVPEPSSWVLACVALGAAIYLRRRSLGTWTFKSGTHRAVFQT